MKKGIQITVLICSGIGFVLRFITLITRLFTSFDYAYANSIEFKTKALISNIPMLFFAGLAVYLLLSILFNRTARFEKWLYLIAAILFVPEIISKLFLMGSYIAMMLLSNNGFEWMNMTSVIILGNSLFGFFATLSICLFLTFQFFNVKRMMIVFAIWFYIVSNIVLTITAIIQINLAFMGGGTISNFWPSIIIGIIAIIWTTGFMFISKNKEENGYAQ